MVTAESRQSLTIIIASVCAQKYAPFYAAAIGIYLHGLAADYAILQRSKTSLVA
jgi:NAD(P)H-hydrate epimerase